MNVFRINYQLPQLKEEFTTRSRVIVHFYHLPITVEMYENLQLILKQFLNLNKETIFH